MTGPWRVSRRSGHGEGEENDVARHVRREDMAESQEANRIDEPRDAR